MANPPYITLNYPVYPSVNLSSNPTPNLAFYIPPFFPAGTQFSLLVTGSGPISPANFTGIGGTIVFTSGNFIFISGGASTGGGGGGGNTTGTNVSITGSLTLNTANFTGIGGTIIFTSGGFVFISGGAGGSFDPLGTAANTGQILYSNIIGFSGTFQDFPVPALTGLSGSQTVNFPVSFSVAPTVVNVNMIILSGNNFGYATFPQNITATNFLCLFSDNLLETGNILSVHAHL
jgi:hypothetical protein